MNCKVYILSALLAGSVGMVSAQTAYKLTALGEKLADVSAVTANGAKLMIYQPGDNNNRTSWLTVEGSGSGAFLKLQNGATDGTNPAIGSDVSTYVFTVEAQDDGTIALRAGNGEYVSSEVTTNNNKANHIATSATEKALFNVTQTGSQFFFNRTGLQGNFYLNTQPTPYVTYWSGSGDWSKWDVFAPTLSAPDTATISMATGALSRTGVASSTWNNLWTSSDSALAVTLTASANNMQAGAGDSIDMRSGSAMSSTYTITLPENYELISYTVKGRALGNAQTVTPNGGTPFVITADTTVNVSVGGGAHSAAFVLSGDNTGLLATIDVVYEQLSARDVTYQVVFGDDTVATAVRTSPIGSPASVPASLSVGDFATFSYEPATIEAGTDTVVATMTWSPTAPIQFSKSLNEDARYYALHISNNARTVYFNYTPDEEPNITCDEKDSLDRGLWVFEGNPYAVRVVNKAAGDTLQLASPTSTGADQTGLAVYAVLSNDFETNPNHLWRIRPATTTSKGAALNTGGFYLENGEGHCLNIRNASGSTVYHLAYWTTGFDAGSSFLPTAATTQATLGATVQGPWTTGRGTETWITRTVVNAPTGSDNGGMVTGLKAQLKEGSADLVDAVSLYAVNNDTLDFYILKNPAAYRVGTATAGLDGELTFDFSDRPVTLSRGQELKLFLTATVKADAPLYETVDATVTGITIDGTDSTFNADPIGEAKVFKTWAPVFRWHNNGYAVWRIPAMARAYTRDGDNPKRLVAVIDGTNDGFQQGNNWNPNPDPGYAPINVFYSISDDNGQTWGKLDTLKLSSREKGNNTYSFGDPAIVRTKSGKLIVMTCATDVNFWNGQKYPYMFTSTDNGETFDEGHTVNTEEILTDEVAGTKGFGGFSWFVTSGHGICTKSGRIMFLVNYIKNNDNNNVRDYVLYSDDEGDHWTIAANPVWDGGGNESKLVQRPDGKILASIRRGGARGFNLSTDESGLTWTTQRMPEEAQGGIHDAGVNADVIAYGDSLLIHSIINNNGSGTTRTDLEIFVSKDNGDTWSKKFCVQGTYAGYSTMEILDNGDLAILFEDGSYHYGNNQYNTNEIHFYDITYLTIPRETIETWGPVSNLTDSVVTGISQWKAADADKSADGRRYNLQGQRVNTAYKGVVIQNGKKQVVR